MDTETVTHSRTTVSTQKCRALKMEVEQLARTSKDFETKKRLLKKKMNIAESARLELPGFKATINDMGACIGS